MRFPTILTVAAVAFGCGAPIRLPIEGPSSPGAGLAWGDETELEPDGSLLVDFGSIDLDKISVQSFLLQNRSGETISIEHSAVAQPFSAFAEALEIPPRSEIRVSFSFSPLAAGEFAADLEIQDGGTTLPVRLRGSALPRQEPEGCRWEVEPSELLFTVGPEEPGIPAESRIWVRALGKAYCKVSAIRISGSEAFSLRGVDGDLVLSGGTRWPIPVTFQPEPGSQSRQDISATLHFEVDGEEVLIPLGTTETPRCARLVENDPPSLLGIGCSSEPWAKIQNICDQDLRSVSTDMTPSAPLAAKLRNDSIPPAGTSNLHIDFNRFDADGPFTTLLVLSFDNGDRLYLPIEAELSFREEEWILGGPPTYLLVVIDNSQAMAPYQKAVEDFARVVARNVRASYYADLHVAVTTTSLVATDGCGRENGALIPLDGSRPRLVNPDTPDLEDVLVENFAVGACAPPGQGAGLEAAAIALGVGGEPSSWLPEGAPVSIIFIAAEDDHSPHPLSHYDSALRPLVRSTSAIVPTGECTNLEPAKRYVAHVSDVWDILPVCKPERWDEVFLSIATASFRPWLDWELEEPLVDLNGDGWIDEEDGLSLSFNGIPIPSEREYGGLNWHVSEDGKVVWIDHWLPDYQGRFRFNLRAPVACSARGSDSL